MIHDLRAILDGWDFEPGKISVRKIIGKDGREKLQTRLDLGLIQCEVDGRPDGARPHQCESLLEYLEQRLEAHVRRHGSEEGYSVRDEDCAGLRQEAAQYYQRYLAFFVLEEYDKVVRDTDRNLRMIDFVSRFADSDDEREAVESHRAYVVMMRTRGAVYDALENDRYELALRQANDGVEILNRLIEQAENGEEDVPEIEVLLELREEVLTRMPADSAPRLNWELRMALEHEDYERAAELRDKLAVSRSKGDAA